MLLVFDGKVSEGEKLTKRKYAKDSFLYQISKKLYLKRNQILQLVIRCNETVVLQKTSSIAIYKKGN